MLSFFNNDTYAKILGVGMYITSTVLQLSAFILLMAFGMRYLLKSNKQRSSREMDVVELVVGLSFLLVFMFVFGDKVLMLIS